MELTLDTNESRAVWQVYADVDDGPVIKSLHGHDMKVTRVRFDYTPTVGMWAVHGIWVMGLRINRDGKPGQRDDSISYGYAHRAPDWAQRAAEHFRPKGPVAEAPIPFCVLSVED